MTIGSDTRFST